MNSPPADVEIDRLECLNISALGMVGFVQPGDPDISVGCGLRCGVGGGGARFGASVTGSRTSLRHADQRGMKDAL